MKISSPRKRTKDRWLMSDKIVDFAAFRRRRGNQDCPTGEELGASEIVDERGYKEIADAALAASLLDRLAHG